MAQMVKNLPAIQLHDTIYPWTLKNKTIESIYKIKADSQTQKTNLWFPKGKWGEGTNQEYELNRYTLLHINQFENKDLLYSTQNYIQQLIVTYNGK